MKYITTQGPYQGSTADPAIQSAHALSRIATAGILAAAALASGHFCQPPGAHRARLWAVMPAMFWMASSLLVSHYIYAAVFLSTISAGLCACLAGYRGDGSTFILAGTKQAAFSKTVFLPAEGNRWLTCLRAPAHYDRSLNSARTGTDQSESWSLRYQGRYNRKLPFDAGKFDAAFAIFTARTNCAFTSNAWIYFERSCVY